MRKIPTAFFAGLRKNIVVTTIIVINIANMCIDNTEVFISFISVFYFYIFPYKRAFFNES